MIRIITVNTKSDRKRFIDFPHQLYKSDPNYVPELFIAQRDMLTPGKHPFHKHSELQLFLAEENNLILGRIAAIKNNNHNSFNNSNDGFFGFFDCIDDAEVSGKLFEAATQWLKERALSQLIGPVNFSTNETCGLLIDGFDSPPVAMMTYNKPYYHDLIADAGLHKKVDLLAWQFLEATRSEHATRLLSTLTERLKLKGITIRAASMKQFKEEVPKIRAVYNEAWDKNLGFVPMTDEEFDYMAKDLKMVLDADFCLVAEHEGKVVAFALCIPDINQILIKIKRGRLLPTGLFKLLTQRKKINGLRIIALGVLEPYRKMGIEGCFFGIISKKGVDKGFKKAEASWILEDNVMMNRAIANANAQVYKKYRIYEKAL